jgi:hypothetical protein
MPDQQERDPLARLHALADEARARAARGRARVERAYRALEKAQRVLDSSRYLVTETRRSVKGRGSNPRLTDSPPPGTHRHEGYRRTHRVPAC